MLASSFFHLFNWDKQLLTMKEVAGTSKLGKWIIGHRMASELGREAGDKGSKSDGRTFYHNVESFEKI